MILYNELINELNSLKDEKYKEFNYKLINDKSLELIGVRISLLKKIAKRIIKNVNDNKGDIINFVRSDSICFEELLVKGLIIGYTKNSNDFILELLYDYINKISNWGVCDSVSNNLKIIKKNLEYFFPFIEYCLSSNREFVVRFGIVNLLNHYVNDSYIDIIIEIIKREYPDYYYINMAIGWLICICYIKYPDKTISLFDGNLKPSINNIAISKINDSYKVSEKDKMMLKKRKIK